MERKSVDLMHLHDAYWGNKSFCASKGGDGAVAGAGQDADDGENSNDADNDKHKD